MERHSDEYYLLQALGVECETMIDRKCRKFYGILEEGARIEYDKSGQAFLYSQGITLTVETRLAKLLAQDHEVTVNNTTYVVHEITKLNDGALSLLKLAGA